ncbi:transcription factor bHLH36-like [Olea europaea subsp. europaea]|uniref:Transcription factor bHLH36-like n=1 Tax=Olea europaea subsp. europaea TaxID=158383 RepID=A0A8S0RYY6_OLEEU|nr:transcription factor bHLH36-like [Olea europaea subsp. europaea]
MSEFPFQQYNDLSFQDPSVFEQDSGILEDLLVDKYLPAMDNHNFPIPTRSRKRQRKTSSGNQVKELDGISAENKKKKLLHRDLEKQRRQEMKKLYASLRSLLPLEYIKGKRAVSDHMLEAVNYIKDMQKSIKELSLRRDKQKKLFTSGSLCGEDENSNINLLTNCVTVSPCREGFEILINTSSIGEVVPLSSVLVELVLRRLNVVSCVSTRTNDQRFLHRIQFEAMAGDLTFIDLLALEKRLFNVINLC